MGFQKSPSMDEDEEKIKDGQIPSGMGFDVSHADGFDEEMIKQKWGWRFLKVY